MQNRGENVPVLTFLHPLRSMFASFTKHVCKPKHHLLKIVNMPFTKRKHGNYDAQTWYLRCANMPLMKHGTSPVFVYAILYERGGCLYKPLQPVMQEMAQMQVGYAIVVVAGEQGGHGDDILGIVVLDGSKIA